MSNIHSTSAYSPTAPQSLSLNDITHCVAINSRTKVIAGWRMSFPELTRFKAEDLRRFYVIVAKREMELDSEIDKLLYILARYNISKATQAGISLSTRRVEGLSLLRAMPDNYKTRLSHLEADRSAYQYAMRVVYSAVKTVEKNCTSALPATESSPYKILINAKHGAHAPAPALPPPYSLPFEFPPLSASDITLLISINKPNEYTREWELTLPNLNIYNENTLKGLFYDLEHNRYRTYTALCSMTSHLAKYNITRANKGEISLTDRTAQGTPKDQTVPDEYKFQISDLEAQHSALSYAKHIVVLTIDERKKATQERLAKQSLTASLRTSLQIVSSGAGTTSASPAPQRGASATACNADIPISMLRLLV